MDNLRIQLFSEIDLNDSFFDSLKKDYAEFEIWFKKKAYNNALVLYNENNNIEGFLYCKYEDGPGEDTIPLLPNTQHMKVGTFKFNPQGTRRGDRYLKKIFDYALAYKPTVKDIYVTVFGDKHNYLFNLFKRYGFYEYGIKNTENGTENVLLRDLTKVVGDVNKDYPLITTENNNKYLLSIYPEFHTRLFPDSILNNESSNIIRDISYSNSIHKLYICSMDGVSKFKTGDLIIIYRTSDGQGSAEFRATATSLCVVESIKNINDFTTEEEFINHCIKFSVFSNVELRKIYFEKKYKYIINFTYNIAFPKRPIRQELADIAGLDRKDYWGVMELNNNQLHTILDLAHVNKESYIRNIN